jgi:uncharacterized membrane protein YhaH (DUF805 family)
MLPAGVRRLISVGLRAATGLQYSRLSEGRARMRNYWSAPFRFKGRIGRKQYWTATLTYVFGGMLGGVLLVVLAALNYNPPDDTITNRTIIGFVLLGIAFIVFAIVIVAGLASTGIRRLHDRGKSEWWLILYYLAPDRLLGETSFWRGAALIIPIAAGAVLIWGLIDLGILRGDPADNRYGPNPLSEKS